MKTLKSIAAALLLTLALVGSVALSGSALAVSPSQEECEARGGTFTRERGEVRCVIVEEGKNPRFTQTETTTGRGNIQNKQEQEEECAGTGSGKCPPGQF